MTRVRVALTGGIASGKSTVSALLRDLGAVVVDADQLARDVVAPGTDGLAEVVAAFGDEVLASDGSLDRPAMARRVFGDEEARRRLERIIHPRVFEAGARLEAEAPEDAVVVHDIPLLAESGRADSFDAVLVVDAPREAQVERMVGDRGWSREDAESRIAAQADRESRLALATHVIDNAGSREDLERRVREVYAELTAGSSGPAFAFERLHHVQLAVPRGSEDRCRAFWGGVLGMQEVAKPPVLAARGGCWFRGGGLEVHLGVEDDFTPARKAHPGILVSDLRALAAALEAGGVEVTWDAEFPGHDRFYAPDPFGNRLEFLEPRG